MRGFGFYNLFYSPLSRVSSFTRLLPEFVNRVLRRQLAMLDYIFIQGEMRDLAEKQYKLSCLDSLTAIDGAGISQSLLDYGWELDRLESIAEKNGATSLKIGPLEVWI